MPSRQSSSKSESGKEKAEALADKLLKRIERQGEAPCQSFSYEIETADVEGTVDRFSQLFRLSQRFGEPIPCFDFGEHGKAPIDFLPLLPWPAQWKWRVRFRGFGAA